MRRNRKVPHHAVVLPQRKRPIAARNVLFQGDAERFLNELRSRIAGDTAEYSKIFHRLQTDGFYENGAQAMLRSKDLVGVCSLLALKSDAGIYLQFRNVLYALKNTLSPTVSLDELFRDGRKAVASGLPHVLSLWSDTSQICAALLPVAREYDFWYLRNMQVGIAERIKDDHNKLRDAVVKFILAKHRFRVPWVCVPTSVKKIMRYWNNKEFLKLTHPVEPRPNAFWTVTVQGFLTNPNLRKAALYVRLLSSPMTVKGVPLSLSRDVLSYVVAFLVDHLGVRVCQPNCPSKHRFV